MIQAGLAFDKSVRHYDADGRLHVDMSNISKAMVCPYRGDEIPDAESLGLLPNKIYYLYRDPDELARAAPTFRNLPLLISHVPVSADEPRKDLVVGSTGSDVEFVAPYLRSSLSVWDSPAIAGIESKEQAELSSAYRYRADMTPGIDPEGVHYDGAMRDIIGNHVALVDIGRAGSDVVVGDKNPFQKDAIMTSKRVSRVALMIAGGLGAYLTPKLAMDKSLGSMSVFLDGIDKTNVKEKLPAISASVKSLFTPKLAQDADLADLDKVLTALAGQSAGMAFDDLDLSDEDDEEDDPDNPGQKRKKAKAQDEDPDAPDDGAPKPPTKAAMDAAIAQATVSATATARREAAELYTAREEVASIVGNKVALDSADAVYRFALDQAKVDHKGIKETAALRQMVKLYLSVPKSSDSPRIAQDAASAKKATEMFPGLSRFKHA